MLAVALFALGAILVIAFVALQGRGGGRIALGSPEGLRPGSVVYHATDHVFVIRLVDGSPLVLSDIDPHNPPGRQTCRVTFRPELGGTEGLAAGRFFDVCSGAMYDIAGRSAKGDWLDLRSVPFELDSEGQLTILEDEAAFNPWRLSRAGGIAV
ncbi:MAG: hypothetical protein EXR66_00755 [Dehalococcoidia bacterium]|nr:hypothetical protein [Dehalococcoidia bacterium]